VDLEDPEPEPASSQGPTKTGTKKTSSRASKKPAAGMFPSRHPLQDWSDDDSDDCVEIPNPKLSSSSKPFDSSSMSLDEEEVLDVAPLASKGGRKRPGTKNTGKRKGPPPRPVAQG